MTALWNADIHVIRRKWANSGSLTIKTKRQLCAQSCHLVFGN